MSCRLDARLSCLPLTLVSLAALGGCDVSGQPAAPPAPSAASNSFGAGTQPDAANGLRPPLVAMSRQEFDDWWRVDVDVQAQPLRAALATIAGEIPQWNPKFVEAAGSGSSARGSGGSLLERKVTLTLEGVSALEAIERACEAAGAHPSFDVSIEGEEIVELHAGPRVPQGIAAEESDAPSPREWAKFVGPVALYFEELEQRPPYATGRLGISAVWPRLPAPLQEQYASPHPVEIVSVTAADRDLMGDRSGSAISVPREESGLKRAGLGRELRHLVRDVAFIDEVRARVKLTIPTAVKTVWFDRIESNWAMDQGETTVTLYRVTKNPNATYVKFTVRGPDPLYGLRAYAFDSAGALLEHPGISSHGASWSEDGRGDGSVSFEGEAAKLAVVLVTGQETFEQEVAFENIPLSEHPAQPEKLEALTFEGAGPLKIEVLSMTEDEPLQKVRLKLVNASNKDVRTVRIAMNYLGPNGDLIEDHETVLRSDDFAPGSLLIQAGASVEREEFAHFFPDEAVRVEVVVQSVDFADGTVWEPAADEP